MNRYLRVACILATVTLLFSSPSWAAFGSVEGTVNRIYTYGSGKILVTGFTFPNATCSHNGAFWIPASHPELETWLSLILTAKATGVTVFVMASIDNCWYPEITTSSSSYMYLKD